VVECVYICKPLISVGHVFEIHILEGPRRIRGFDAILNAETQTKWHQYFSTRVFSCYNPTTPREKERESKRESQRDTD
jgi:hypothetical protein